MNVVTLGGDSAGAASLLQWSPFPSGSTGQSSEPHSQVAWFLWGGMGTTSSSGTVRGLNRVSRYCFAMNKVAPEDCVLSEQPRGDGKVIVMVTLVVSRALEAEGDMVPRKTTGAAARERLRRLLDATVGARVSDRVLPR